MSSYCQICSNSCNFHPLPLSNYLMETCNSACIGEYGQDDMRCCLFVFVPCSFVIDILCICPRCGKNCYRQIKEKNASNNVISSQPVQTNISDQPVYVIPQVSTPVPAPAPK